MKIFGKEYTKTEILRKVGNISQIGGVRAYTLMDGSSSGTRAIDVNTGSGLMFTVLADRGLDISRAFFNGASLCWNASVGEVNPTFFDKDGLNWLRSMYGGLLITCGLTYMGAPCEDQGEALGLHGRYSNIPASNVSYNGEWQGDEYILSIKGSVRESHLFGPNIVLNREISTKLGSSSISIKDNVINESFDETPFMILYHCNIGFPLLDENAQLYSKSKRVIIPETKKEAKHEQYAKFLAPTHGFKDKVFYHNMEPDADDYVSVILANHNFGRGKGLGILQRYKAKNLPNYIQWKMCGEGAYILGMEPGNCHVEGRAKARKDGSLVILKPGESRDFHLELCVLSNNEEIQKTISTYGLR